MKNIDLSGIGNVLCDDQFILRIFKESPYNEPTDEACQYIKNKIGFDLKRIKSVIENEVNKK